MRKILILLIICQMAFANVKDTLQVTHPFLKYGRLLEMVGECDACGCSSNGGSMGFSSMLDNNFAGIRYVYQNYTTKQGVFNDSPWTDEHFNTVQIWARIPVSERIHVSVLLPFHTNSRELVTGKEQISGLGDATVLALYSLYMTQKDSATFTHKLQLGGGIKAPTGKYDALNNGTLNPSFQLGTGSWDFLLVTEYAIRRKQLGINTALNYIVKSENQKHYRFGDQFNYGSTVFYFFNLKKVKLVPQAGIAGEIYQSNQQLGQEVAGTKGSIMFSKFGVEAGKDKFSLGINAMLPLSQNLTDGNVRANYRLAVNLNYQL